MTVLTLAIVGLHFWLEHSEDWVGPRRFMPIHVATIATAFLIFAALGITGIIFEDFSSWRTIAWLIAFALSTIAQGAMLDVVKSKIRHGRR